MMWIYDNKSYYLTIVGAAKLGDNKLLYEVQVNQVSYIITKSFGMDDFEQLDSFPPVRSPFKQEILKAIRRIESLYAKNKSIKSLNEESKNLFNVKRKIILK